MERRPELSKSHPPQKQKTRDLQFTKHKAYSSSKKDTKPVTTELVKSSSSSSSKKKKGRTKGGEYVIPVQTSVAVKIPCEIFIKICEFLPPAALLSLSRVCRLYRGFLYSTTSSLSQQMWTTSRINFMRTLPLPPPEGMDEIAYIKLALVERGCQFCQRKSKPKVYWAFRVRCCRKCLNLKTQNEEIVRNSSQHIPDGLATRLPYVTLEETRYFWKDDVQAANLEYSQKSSACDRHLFLHQLTEKRDERMEDAAAREIAAKQGRSEEIAENKMKLLGLIERMSQELSDDGNPIYQLEVLKKCPSYLKASCSLDKSLDLSSLRHDLDKEYHGIITESVRKKKQRNLLQLIIRLRTSLKEVYRYEQSKKSTARDPSSRTILDIPAPSIKEYADHALDILSHVTGQKTDLATASNYRFMQPLDDCEKLLRFCSSYNNCTYELNRWNENFFLKTLIPRLCREAASIDQQYQPCFTVRKALAQGWATQRVFKCRLCSNRKQFDYAAIKQHLQSLRHNLQTFEDDKMMKLHLMHGIMSDGPSSFWLAHLPIPNIVDSKDVIVKVRISGLCPTDTQTSKSIVGDLDKRTVMGHQFVAEIYDTGSSIKNFTKGDLVMCPPKTSCGECFYCKREMTFHCEKGQLFGWSSNGKRFDGGQAEYVRVPYAETSLFKVPEGVSEKEALLLADFIPVGFYCAENAMNQLSEEEKAKSVIVVVGCSAVGLAAIASSFYLGAKRVFAIDRTFERLQVAHAFGATIIEAATEDPIALIRRATGGRGADVALVADFETDIDLSLKLLRPAGILSIATMNCQPPMDMTYSEQDVVVISKHCPIRKVIPKTIPMVKSKKFDFESIITHMLPLRDAEEAYKLVGGNPDCLMMSSQEEPSPKILAKSLPESIQFLAQKPDSASSSSLSLSLSGSSTESLASSVPSASSSPVNSPTISSFDHQIIQQPVDDTILWHKPMFTMSTLIKLLHTISRQPQTFPYALLIRRLNFSLISENVSDAILNFLNGCERLERLTLGGCRQLTDIGLTRLINKTEGLVALDVSDIENLTDAVIELVGQRCRRLQGLNVSLCKKITDKGVIAVASRCRNLRRIKLSGCENITDNSIVVLAENCPHLLELDLTNCNQITNNAIQPVLERCTQLRELRLNTCTNLTDEAFTRSMPAFFEQLRILDLTSCALITDQTLLKIVYSAPKLRNLGLAKCVNITDEGVNHITRLGKHLHYLHLGHCSRITDHSITNLARHCTRLRYLDLACCVQLTDASVHELSHLPKLKRIGLVKCANITDSAIYALIDHRVVAHTLERVHLSYCINLTITAVLELVNCCYRLTHLSLTGVPAFLRSDLQRLCRPPPKEFTQHQRQVFCVFSGKGVKELRQYLNSLVIGSVRPRIADGGPDGTDNELIITNVGESDDLGLDDLDAEGTGSGGEGDGGDRDDGDGNRNNLAAGSANANVVDDDGANSAMYDLLGL
ncbi:7140_t:CDS:2 [Ambispora leptoticha]|uniref:7140_t:CDS:1 n=1 Tax=Ambispora leptoticha TaxID=144679 RepID=A0A9N8VZ15_9GLOM|nr:7140_t:CDS:2 [Ambispora leptoticha]